MKKSLFIQILVKYDIVLWTKKSISYSIFSDNKKRLIAKIIEKYIIFVGWCTGLKGWILS